MVSYQALLESKMGTCNDVHGVALTPTDADLQGFSQEMLLSACLLRLIPPIRRDLERKRFPEETGTHLWCTGPRTQKLYQNGTFLLQEERDQIQ